MSALGGILGLIGGLGGGLLSASGAKSAANAQNAAMEKALQQQLSEGGNSQVLLSRLLYGGQGGDDLLRQLLPADRYAEIFGTPGTGPTPLTLQEQRRREELMGLIQGGNQRDGPSLRRAAFSQGGTPTASRDVSAWQAELDLLDQKAGGTPGKAGRFDPSTDTGTGLLGQFDDIASRFGAMGDRTMRGYDATTQKLLGDYMALEKGAKDYGAGQEARIKRDAAQQEVGLNRRASAMLGSRGIGNSTLYGNQAAANNRTVTQDAQDRIMDLNDAQIRFLTELGQGRVGLAGNRASQRLALDLSNQDRNYGLQTNKLNTQLAAMGPLAGATNGVDFARFAPTASGGGNFAQSFGNTLAGLGGYSLSGGFDSIFGGGTPRATTQNNTNTRRGPLYDV